MLEDRSHLTTERANPRTADIDRRTTLQIVDLLNAEDRRVAPAVRKERKRIAQAVDLIAGRFRRGGRLLYVGAGTSGRLGVLDASECPPTFGVPRTMVQGIIAGGRPALVRSAESREDDPDAGADALRKKRLRARDAVVGIAACGLTPYVRGAIEYAREVGAGTVFFTCNPEVVGQITADVVINPVVGPEAVTGSTRLKAGTATKLVLNTLTTAAMIRLGKVYGNLMVDLRATNAKLRERAERIAMEMTGLTRRRARSLLERAGGELKVALVMHLRGVDAATAKSRLQASGGMLRGALGEG